MRLKRYFNDMFGVMNFVFLMSENHHLTQNDSGNYYLSIKGDCGNSNVVSVQPWWLESGTTINICSNSTGATQVFQDQEEINCFVMEMKGFFMQIVVVSQFNLMFSFFHDRVPPNAWS